MTPSALPCPFCGEKPKMGAFLGQFCVECENQWCPARSVFVLEPTEAEAITRWNQRSAGKSESKAEG
jgi:hypothetical protein